MALVGPKCSVVLLLLSVWGILMLVSLQKLIKLNRGDLSYPDVNSGKNYLALTGDKF